MNLQDLGLKISYITFGEENLRSEFLNPALSVSKNYYRSVGFFSVSVFESILQGIMNLVRRGGKIKVLASPRLTLEDIEAIELGYEIREDLYRNAFSKEFEVAIQSLSDENLQIAAQLIGESILDIKILDLEYKKDSYSIYHDKFGILEDTCGNKVVFIGSANETQNGLEGNYEKVRVFNNWTPGVCDYAQNEIEEFESLWNGTNEFIKTYDFSDAIKQSVVAETNRRENTKKGFKKGTSIKLRDYQNEAIEAWKNNGFRGFFVMATGTGKTWTAIFAAKELLLYEKSLIVIAAPYKHLVKQWAEDLSAAFTSAKIVLVSSENAEWETELTNAIVVQRLKADTQIIAITTIKSFYSSRFTNAINKSHESKLLIVDEAHRFTKHDENVNSTYKYKLGLSATPFNGKNAKKGHELMNFFGGQIYNLPIESALERKCLVPYNYYPIIVNSTQDEEDSFKNLTHKIAGCFDKSGRIINPDALAVYYRSRLRIMAMADEKITRIQEILSHIKEHDHFIVYCGDGKVLNSHDEEIRHINFVKRTLNELGYKSSQFTATETMDERMSLVKNFNDGMIDTLVAIRCLDEGINIPSIKGALILASNDDYREFTQRRGRILRLYEGKEQANIYDVIVLPSVDCPGIATIELRRFKEYASLASNCDSLMVQLKELLEQYSLNEEEIDFSFEIEEDLVEDE